MVLLGVDLAIVVGIGALHDPAHQAATAATLRGTGGSGRGTAAATGASCRTTGRKLFLGELAILVRIERVKPVQCPLLKISHVDRAGATCAGWRSARLCPGRACHGQDRRGEYPAFHKCCLHLFPLTLACMLKGRDIRRWE